MAALNAARADDSATEPIAGNIVFGGKTSVLIDAAAAPSAPAADSATIGYNDAGEQTAAFANH